MVLYKKMISLSNIYNLTHKFKCELFVIDITELKYCLPFIF